MVIDFSNINGGGGGGYVLPIASNSVLGGVKVGQNLSIDSGGTLSADAQAVGVATTASTGVVQVGSGLSITSGGVLSTDIDLSDYAEKSDLNDYATVESLSGYVETSAMSGYVETSDLETFVPNYAMALKDTLDDDKVINESGCLYSINKINNEPNDIFVKVKMHYDFVEINIDIDEQTDTDIVEFNGVTISIDEFGELFYFNGEENIYFDGDNEYQYGDFTFTWSNDGKDISFDQQETYIDPRPLTDNREIWYCIGEETYIANQNQLGLVKIGEGLIVDNDGTVSVAFDDANMKYINSDNNILRGVYINQDSIGNEIVNVYSAKKSFTLKYDQLFQTDGYGSSLQLTYNDNYYVAFRAVLSDDGESFEFQWASSNDDFENWTTLLDGDVIGVSFGEDVNTVTFYATVEVDNDLGYIKVDYSDADDGWTLDSNGEYVFMTKIANKDGVPLPKMFNGMLLNNENKLQKADVYVVTNECGDNLIEIDPPYSDIYGFEICGTYLEPNGAVIKTDYNNQNNERTRSLAPYISIYRNDYGDLTVEIYNGVDVKRYHYAYSDGMDVGIDADGYAVINGEQRDEIIEGGGATFFNTHLFEGSQDCAKVESFCIRQYDEENDDYFDLHFYTVVVEGRCMLASENYERIIKYYAEQTDSPISFDVISFDNLEKESIVSDLNKLRNANPKRRFLICTEGQDLDENDAPFVCNSDGFMFDYDHQGSEFYLYDTLTYDEKTELITLISAYQEGEEGEEEEVTGYTVTIFGTPDGYTIEYKNPVDDYGDTVFVNNLNEKVYANDDGQGLGNCDLYAVKINNGLVVHYVNAPFVNYPSLPLDSEDNDIKLERGSYLDTVMVGNAIYRCSCDDNFLTDDYWELYINLDTQLT